MELFIDTVHMYFDALASRYGLPCIISTPQIVRYANEKIFVQVLYEAYGSHEVGVEVGEVPSSANYVERPFNLSEILRLHDAPDAGYVGQLQASKPDVLAGAIKQLSVLLEKYASEILEGSMGFERLGRFRDNECVEYALSRDLGYARESAEKAWVMKDYVAVIKAYKSIEYMLTELERKRLRFAEKHT